MKLWGRLLHRVRYYFLRRAWHKSQQQARRAQATFRISGPTRAPQAGPPPEPEPDTDPLPGPRRRILFVDRTYPRETGNDRHGFILDGLRMGYDVVVDRDLCMDTVYCILRAERENLFDAMVTHVPFNYTRRGGIPVPDYTPSIDVLAEIRRQSNIPIVAYTGADGLYSSGMWDYIDRKVSKSNDYQQDLDRIRKCLRTLILEAAEPFAVPLPKIERMEGNTTVEACVNRRGGLGLTEIYRICDECMKYPGTVAIQRLEPLATPSLADARNPMELMLIELIEGSRILVTVEGEDSAAAENLAKRLYGILTARYGYQISVGDTDDSK